MSRKSLIVLAVCFLLTGCGSSKPADFSSNPVTPGVSSQVTPEAFQQQAVMLLSQGQVPAAVELLQKATDLFPDDTNLYFTLAQVYMKIGSFDNAIAISQKMLQKNPENGHIYLLMAGCYDLKNDSQKAIELVKTSMTVFQKKNDDKNFEAATAILKKLTDRAAEKIPPQQKVTK